MTERLSSKLVNITFEGLIERIDLHLLNAMVENDRPESILDKVLEEYTHDVRRSGQVPAQFENEVLEDLRELALDVIRKRTYGCITIESYRKKISPKR